MTAYVADIWRCRFFWMSLVQMDLRTRYRRSILGMGWSLLHPIAMTIVLCVVFHTVFHQPIREYAPFLLAGLALWNFITSSALQGCQCFFQGESYIRQYPAPVAIYPLRTALGGAIHFLLALGVTLGLAWYFKGFGNVPSLVTLPFTVLLLFFFTWGLAVLAGFANVHFQDTQHLTEVLFQILFYATPIMYKADQLRGSIFARLVQYNPLVAILDIVRVPVVDGQFPSLHTYTIAFSTVLVTVVAASITLSRLQRRLIFYL